MGEEAATTGIEFTETMRGSFAKDPASNEPLEFSVTIRAPDIDQFIRSRFHRARITGTVTAPSLSPQPLEVSEGEFNLFIEDPQGVNTKKMLYLMHLRGVDGQTYTLRGIKTVRNDPGLDLWSDTTTLRVELFAGDDTTVAPIGVGVMTIAAADFAHQLTTIRAVNARNPLDALRTVARFGTFFAGALYETYGGVLARANVFNPDAPPREKRQLDLPAPEVHSVDAGDGVILRLTRYHAGDKGPVMCVHGLGVNSKIFSTDLIERNLVEELAAHSYDVWLLDYRSSIDLPYAKARYTGDEVATKDYPAAVRAVREISGAETIQCLVHCFGASTFFMAMLAGLSGVRSAAVSQIATHLEAPFSTRIKTMLHAANVLDRLGFDSLTAYVDAHGGLLERLADVLLKLYPVHDGPRDTSPVSRRISFLYGQLYELSQLNQQTYDNLHELFGVASITSLEHLATMIRHGYLVDASGRDVYLKLEQGPQALKPVAIPIAFVHGELNKCWDPHSTEVTLRLLSDANGTGLYKRKVISGYGHIDCIFGKNASRDVFPFFIQHFDEMPRP